MKKQSLHNKSIQQAINTAILHHQAGQLGAAEPIYNQVLAIDPENFDALHLLGVMAHQSGDNEAAITMIEKALRQDKTNPFAFNNLGEAYRALHRLIDAEKCYCNAVLLKPDYFEAYNNLGNTLQCLGRLEMAAQAYRQAITLKPDHFGPYNNLGNLLISLGRLDEAGRAFQQALLLNPDYAEAHNNYGNYLLTSGQSEEAERAYQQALRLKPDYAVPYNNLGKVYIDRGQLEEGLGAYRKAIELQSEYDEAYYNLGTTYQEIGQLEAAELAFNKALSINPDYASCRWNLSLLMLLQGRYEQGFKLYEDRFAGGDSKVFEKINGLLDKLGSHLRWQGEALHGKSLLIIAEQGLGDNLMMMRYFALLKQLAPKRLIVYCEQPLKRLLECLPEVDVVVSMSESLPFGEFDLYCPSMSLPFLFQTRLESILSKVPYLVIPEDLQQLWRTRFAGISQLKVGLVWAGKGSYKKNQVRSMSLNHFSPLIEIPGVQFFSLQKGDEAGQLQELGWDFIDWIDECSDLLDSAALINQLDLIISVDTSVAHLSGALGKPVWLLNRFGSEWRWLLGRENSPWYPSMKIFRQEKQDSWTGVINHIAEDLRSYQGASAIGSSEYSICDNAEAFFKQGVERIEAGDYPTAETCFRDSLRLAPHSLEAKLNLGYVLNTQGSYEESLQCCELVLAESPNCSEARYNRAVHLLRKGDFRDGFDDYEARFEALKDIDRRSYSQPIWDGSPLGGRTILVCCEQGLGDAIMFVRFIPLLIRQGGRVVLEAQEPLVPLFASLPGVEKVVSRRSNPPVTDCYIHLLSLPHMFHTTLESLPCQIQYLAAPEQLIAEWQERIGTANKDYRIGLVWACKGRPLPNRTCPPEHLAPLLSLPSIRFFSLQVGEKDRFPLPEKFARSVIDVADDFRDFADTAACIMSLDLVITVDAAVAHLAGALGKPVWVMLPLLSDWRWQLDRSDSPWYPGMRLFRQPMEGDWHSVVAEVIRTLQEQLQQVQATNLTEDEIPNANTETRVGQNSFQAGVGKVPIGEMDIAACYDLGAELTKGGDLVGAEHCFRRIVALAPELPDPQHALGVVLQLQGQLKEAVRHYRVATSLDPDFVKSHYNLAEALSQSGLYQEAITSVNAALHCDTEHADAHWLLGMLLLQSGDFVNGWREYEWRWKSSRFTSRIPELGRPVWDGSPLAGKTLLIHMEQGRGDMIQFVRYASLAADTGGTVVVCAQRDLVSLLEMVAGVSQVVDRDGQLPPFDVHIPVQSFPYLMGTALETIPDKIPYIVPDPSKMAEWKSLMPEDGSVRVGLVWQGAQTHKNDQNRSCALSEFKPLIGLDGITFFSLQMGAGVDQLSEIGGSLPIADWTSRIKDFSDTAALIANMDLVISVDTAVAHLAGALGKPVWTLLPFVPEWRWLLGRNDSPWYPTMRLFRQIKPGDWPGLIAQVRQALRHLLSGAEFHNQRGIELFQSGLFAEAEQAFTISIGIDQNYAEPLCNLGAVLDSRHKYEEALDRYAAAIAIRPDYMQAFFNMGNTCRSLGNLDAARTCYEQAHALAPDFVPACLCLGGLHKNLGQFDCAREYFDIAIRSNPNNVDAYQGLAESFKGQDELQNSVEACQLALEIEPKRVSVINLLGLVYHLLGRFNDSAACYRKALSLDPDNTAILNNYGTLLDEFGKTEEAVSIYNRIIEIDPGNAEGHWNLALTLLARGEYQKGWQEYEWRFKKKQPVPIRDFCQPRWDGSMLHGRTILLHCEQGFGDTIQFVRYVPLVVPLGGKVIIECQVPALKRLLQSLDGDVQVVSSGEPLPPFDCHLPLMSLPLMFGTTLETVPSQIPYLAADPADIEVWQKRLGNSKNLRVGLVWYARQAQLLSRKRLCPLVALSPLASIPGIEFYTLQIGEGAEQLKECEFGNSIRDFTVHIQDFADTAAFIANLDLVITIDTAVAHLAGAIDKPTWLLLPFAAEWRWMEHRRDCPWYPSMRLFRQPVHEDWSSVAASVVTELNSLAAGGESSEYIADDRCLQTASISKIAKKNNSNDAKPILRVGLAWSCRKESLFTINRICPFSALSPLLDLPGISFVSLQLGDGAEKPVVGSPLIDLTGDIKDFEDTAALMANLDLIISIDTSVAHLAGALGRPTWLLLPYVAEWRWQLNRCDTPWYPGMRLFRQPDFGDWTSVIREVVSQLENMVTDPLEQTVITDFARIPSHGLSPEQQALEQVLEKHQNLVAINPSDLNANLDHGVALAMLGRFDEATDSFRRVLALDSDHVGGHRNLAFVLLALGKYSEAWQHYEWRLRLISEGQIPPWPMLTRVELFNHQPGTALLVHCEQGYGDTIMFSRFLPLLVDAGYRVVISCQPPLASIASSLRGVCKVVPHGELLPVCDLQVLMLSLPELFSVTLDNRPAEIPYLAPRPELVCIWKIRLEAAL